MSNKKIAFWLGIILIIIFVVAIGFFIWQYEKNGHNLAQTQQSTQESNKKVNNFRVDEVIKETIGVNGGILQNADKSVVITIPPLKQDTEFTLSFKRSNFEVRAGVGSPITISLYPDINLMDSPPTPIKIKVKYDAQYNLPMGYLIDENNKLHVVDFGGIDKENHYFTMLTFHGGNYSWICTNY